MRILVINPNSDLETQRKMEQKAAVFVHGAYDVEVVSLKRTPKLISSYKDMADGIEEMVEIVQRGVEYDAFVVACHSDPNLDLLKEITNKPVVGIAEASMKIASMYGSSFAVISPSVKSISKKKKLARKYHCQELFAATRVAAGDDCESILQAARAAAEEDHVDCIVLGCANYVNADRYVEQKLGIPVFDGLACALILASGLAGYHRFKSE